MDIHIPKFMDGHIPFTLVLKPNTPIMHGRTLNCGDLTCLLVSYLPREKMLYNHDVAIKRMGLDEKNVAPRTAIMNGCM